MGNILKALSKIIYLLQITRIDAAGNVEISLHGNQIKISPDGISLYSEGIIRLNGLYTFIQCDSKFDAQQAQAEIEKCQQQEDTISQKKTSSD